MAVTDDERSRVAKKMRKYAEDGKAFLSRLTAKTIGADYMGDAACWNRLADLIEPTPTSFDRGLTCDRDALLDLADRMEGYARFCRERSIQVGNNLVECYARRIREAVDACEARPDAPVAVDDEKTDTDAYMDDSEAAEGYNIVDVSDKFNENIAAIDFVRDNGGLEAVKARLMPEGMEWPRFEDGEPVRIGDRVMTHNFGQESTVTSVRLHDGGSSVFYRWCGEDDGASVYGERVKRPAPKVYDADGVPIHVGETVYVIGHDEPLAVGGFAADGRVLMDFHNDDSLGYRPEKLTHERPDSWKLLEEDAGKNPFDYCKDVGHRLDTCENSEAYKARDLVRRAKALAGVSE